jgi:hypothetical protein
VPPAVVRPAFTLGGHGGGFADTPEQLRAQVERGLSESPINQVLVEESVRGWDEFELEVVRDHADNVVIVCSIENLDPMGVHTGDSVTVAPQMTLSDEAYQELRDAAIAVIREDTTAKATSTLWDCAFSLQYAASITPSIPTWHCSFWMTCCRALTPTTAGARRRCSWKSSEITKFSLRRTTPCGLNT